MAFSHAVRSIWAGIRDRADAHGLKTAFAWGIHQACYYYPLLALDKSEFDGVNVFDREWDILLVLDGARVNTMIEVAADRDRIDSVESLPSVAGRSSTWLRRTFGPRREQLSDVAYVTANPNTEWFFDETAISRDDFGTVDEVWTYAWDDDIGTVEPGVVTDRVISTHRESNHDSIIGHYMQPHFPSIPDPIGSDISLDDLTWENSAWNQLEGGEISRDRVLESFQANLEYVLDEVELLVENVDGTVAITSDHGNAAGEWGYFGHNDWPVQSIVQVPWFRIQATDTGRYTPELESPESPKTVTEAEVNERLEMLGYRT